VTTSPEVTDGINGVHEHHVQQRARARDYAARAAAIIAVLLFAGLLAQSDQLHEQVVSAIGRIDPIIKRHPVGGAVLFAGLAGASAMLVFFSSVLLVPIGVAAWGKTVCMLLLLTGWTLGGVLTYTIGRFLGRPVVEKMLSRKVIDLYENRIPRSAPFLTLVLIQIAVPSDVSGYFFGLLRFKAGVYLSALILAEIPYALGTVFLGAAFIERQYSLLFAAGGVALLVVSAVWFRVKRARARGNAA